MSEPTTPAGYSDFTHRDYRPDHVANPTPKGIQYPINMTPQKAGKLLVKAVAKPGLVGKKRKAKHGKPVVKTPAKMVMSKR